MANSILVDQLPEAASASTTDVLPISASGTLKKIKVNTLFQNMDFTKVIDLSSLDSNLPTGFYAVHAPTGDPRNGLLINVRWDINYAIQIYNDISEGLALKYRMQSDHTWHAWMNLT